jgi:hypothetical protein
VSTKKYFCQKVTNGGITENRVRHQCFFYEENLALFFVSMFETQLFRKILSIFNNEEFSK